MAFLYTLYQDTRSNGNNMWYARPYYQDIKDLDDIVDEVSYLSTAFSKGKIRQIIYDLADVVANRLIDGDKVKIDGVCILAIGVNTKPAQTEEDFDYSFGGANIKGMHVKCVGTGTLYATQMGKKVQARRIAKAK